MLERLTNGTETGAYSTSVIGEGRFLFVAGRGPMRDGRFIVGTIEEETIATLDSLMEAIAKAGGRREDIVRCGCFLADINDFATFDGAYRTYFGDSFPARTTIGCQLGAGIKVEIDAIVLLPSEGDGG